jgi:hypothetical protein
MGLNFFKIPLDFVTNLLLSSSIANRACRAPARPRKKKTQLHIFDLNPSYSSHHPKSSIVSPPNA